MIAEAAPEIFLQAVEIGLDEKKPPVMSLFIEEGPMGGCLFASLIGGLECISWNLDYTSRVVLILANLSKGDPGGKWSNRPYDALKEIFRGWLPQTMAPLDKRLKILDSLIRYKSELGWKLLIDLLPERGGSVSTPIYVPQFRDWAQSWEKGVTLKEYQDHIIAVSERILQQVSEEPKTRWMDLVRNLSILPEIYVSRATNQLGTDFESLTSEIKNEIYEELRKLISQHRQFSTAKWALPTKYIDELDVICKRALPEDLVLRYKFLFDSGSPAILNPALYSDHEENSKRIEKERSEALEQIWNKEQILGLERIAKIIQFPGILGNSLGNVNFADQAESTILSWLSSENLLLIQTARAYVSATFFKRKNQWLSILQTRYSKSWSDRTWASFCLGLPFGKDLFDFLQKFEEPARKVYWENVSRYFLLEEDSTYINWVIEELLFYNRALNAIDAAANFLYTIAKGRTIDSDLLARTLEKAANDLTNSKRFHINHDFYSFQKVLTEIEKHNKIDSNRLAHIEWFYLPMFENSEIRPMVLINEVLCNPIFFVHLVCLMFKPNPPVENEFPNLQTEQVKVKAENAWRLLKLIDQVPGQNGSVAFDVVQLRDWVLQARQSFEQKNRKRIGDEMIGEILSCFNRQRWHLAT